MNKKAVLGASLGTLSLVLAACGSSSSSSSSGSATTSASVNWANVTSASAGGGFNALVAAAKKEGHLNVVALPPGWANYGAIISSFEKKYGITITASAAA